MAKSPPDIGEIPLDRGEFTEVLLRGVLRDPEGVGRLTAVAERFLGQVLTGRRWILLTNKRLLLLRARSPKRYREGEWFDVAFDRRSLRPGAPRSEEHTSELQSRPHLVCRLLLEKKKKQACQ